MTAHDAIRHSSSSHAARARGIPRAGARAIVLGRALAGLAVAATVALAARRAHALSDGGTLAALLVGGVAVAAGWGWGALLIAYFALSIALSKLRATEKAERTGSVVAKGGARDAIQVVANGGVYAATALAGALATDLGLPALGATLSVAALGALAASAADTWATEIGSLAARPPRSIVTWRPVAPGTSGGVNASGMAAMVAGAAFVALGARAVDLHASVGAVVLGGFLGAIADSVVGATLQERRWCDTCQTSTERTVHGCGTATRHAAGLAAVDNDLVNLIATVAGAAVAALVQVSRTA